MDEPEIEIKKAGERQDESGPAETGSASSPAEAEPMHTTHSRARKQAKEQKKAARTHRKRSEEAAPAHPSVHQASGEQPSGSAPGSMGAWRFAAIAAAILLLVSIFTSGFRFGNGQKDGIPGLLSQEDAVQSVVIFINQNLLRPGSTLTVQESEDIGALYRLGLAVDGQPVEGYVTKDGKYFIPQAVPLTGQLPQQRETPQAPAETARVAVSADDDAVKGDASAPVTIIEFSDFQCPFCGRFFEQTLPEIEETYIKTGKARLVYRDFPLESIHPNARPAAEAAECAKEQGKFWQFHDKLFANQQQLSVENYKKWAAEIGMDAAKFNGCVDKKKYAAEVSKDLADGSAAGVQGTPAFFVNGKALSGAQPFSAFEAIIEEELKAAAGSSGAEAQAAAPGTESGAQAQEAPAAPAATGAAAAAGVREFSMTAKKFRFEPDTIAVKKGDTVRLLISSTDVDHGFAVPELGVSAELKAGTTTTVEFTASKSGRFPFVCSVYCGSGHSVMKGTLIVE